MCVQLQSPSFSFSGRSIRTGLSLLAQIRKRLVRPNCQVETPSPSHEEHGPGRRLKFRLRTKSIYQPASKPASRKMIRRGNAARTQKSQEDLGTAARITPAQPPPPKVTSGVDTLAFLAQRSLEIPEKKVATHHAVHSPTGIASLSTDSSLYV